MEIVQRLAGYTPNSHAMTVSNKVLISQLLATCAAFAEQNQPLNSRQRGLVCRSDTFDGILLAAAQIETIARVNNASSYGEDRSRNPAYPILPANLPELCSLTVNVTTSPTSFYRFGLFLPTEWNSRFLAVGNGGFAGGINWLDMGSGVRYGFAAMSTDTGHNSTSGDVSWALHQDERQKDFGFRAMHGAVELSKRLILAYYSDPPRRSYYSGCSTGGRQGLKEIQLHPDSFDGALIGAPAWWTPNLAAWTTKVHTYNAPAQAAHHIPAQLIGALSKEVLRQCDAVDGVADGIISAPEQCKFDFAKILCGNPGVEASTCLTSHQVNTAKAVYGDYVIGGKFFFPGLSLGSEDLWSVLLGQAGPDPRGQDYVRNFIVNDTNWDWRTYNDTLAEIAAAADPGDAAAGDFDIAEFRDRGGKIIMYNGDADGMIPPKSSDYYYKNTAAAMGGTVSLQSWFRYFRVPGLGHCSGTRVNAPWYFAGGNQAGSLGTGTYSVPRFADAQHDALLALVDWVEKGTATESIIATTWNSPSDPASGVLRQRPLCPFPKIQVLKQGGDEKVASDWTCASK